MRHILLAATTAAVATLLAPCAFAQRAAENAVNSAEDAFGVSVGTESVGLYSTNSARGFNPGQAGNIRLNGLYFDQQNQTQGRIFAETSMRVGLSAQSYPFPAPTGIADIRLRRPPDKVVGSVAFTYGPYTGSVQGDAEISTPIIPGKLRGMLAVTGFDVDMDQRTKTTRIVYSGLLNWTPNDNVEVIAFKQGHEMFGEVAQLVFTASGAPPLEFDRKTFFGQPWARRHRNTDHYGVLAKARVFDDWLLQGGLFRSTHHLTNEHTVLFRNTQPDGTADLSVLRNIPNHDFSNSGEVRLSRAFTEGPRLHTFHLAVRGRQTEHLFGGGGTQSLGTSVVGVPDYRPEPTFTLAPANLDRVSQITPGLSYVGRWRDIGEISFGVQKTSYRRDVTLNGLPTRRTESQPWLYNGTLAAYLSKDLILYAGYTRGLEEAGFAPESASNRGEALPASLTEQVDAGFRYKLGARATLIAGVFEVKKPYFDRNAANLYTHVGALSHQGIEVSFSGQPLPGLTVVAGVMLLKARIEADTAVANFIGAVPAGRPNRNVRLNLQYAPSAWRGFSVDAQVNQDGPAYANRANTLRLEAGTTLDLGARYVFKVFGTSASLRARLQNVTNSYDWSVSSTGAYSPSSPRRFVGQMVVDF